MSKLVEARFNFRKNPETGLRRETVEVNLPVPNATNLITMLQGEDRKTVAYIEDLVASALQAHVRATYVEPDENFNQETLDALVADGKISVEVLANLPKSERNVLGKEQLEEFAKDFAVVMVEKAGLELKRVQVAAGLFVERFKRVAGDTAVLQALKGRLETFIEHASDEQIAQHERVLTYLTERLEELLSADITVDAI